MSELWSSNGAHAGPASSESQSIMIDGGRLVQMESSTSGREFSQGHVCVCAQLLVVRLEATIVIIPGESKRCEL